MTLDNENHSSPSISIVTTCFNSLKFINRLQNSLCNQSYKNFEWVVVDDCSTDGTISVLMEMSSPGNLGMKVFRLPHNTGGGLAAGLAVKKAIGDIVLLIDHDDELVPEALMSIIRNWSLVSDDETLCGLFFARIDPKTGNNIGESLKQGMKFSMSFLANKMPSITDGAIPLKGQVAKKYFTPVACERICLAGVFFNNMTKTNRLVAVGGQGIVIYHRDNPESLTNSVKISRRTVYTYAKYIDLFDRYYFLRPFYWIRHLVALIKISIAVHKNPFYHYKYIDLWAINLLSFFLTPVGVASYIFSRKDTILHFPEFCISDLNEFTNLRCKP